MFTFSARPLLSLKSFCATSSVAPNTFPYLSTNAVRLLCLSTASVGFLTLTGCASHPVGEPEGKITYVNGSPSSYVVRKGETLSLIASRYRLDYRKIAALNGLDSNYTVYAGQKLRLSGLTPARRTTSLPARPAKSPASKNYRSPSYAAIATPVVATQKTWVTPVAGSVFKNFNPANSVKGTWYKASAGTVVVASQSGTVLYAGDKLSEYGNLVMIRHDSDFVTVYAHLASIGVQEGQAVQVGQNIGTVGMVAGQPVMEFQIRYRGTPVNPVSFLK